MSIPTETYSQPLSQIDQDFAEVEAATSLEDIQFGMEFARDYMDSLGRSQPDTRRVSMNGPSETHAHYVLPGISSKHDNLEHYDETTIRPDYSDKASYVASDQRSFIRVGQGEMWDVAKDGRTYLQLTMSECSALIGRTEDDRTIVSHISFSLKDETAATVEYMRQQGVMPERMHVIGSLGRIDDPTVEHVIWPKFSDRVNSIAGYTDLGIPAENVHPFQYSSTKDAIFPRDNDNGQRPRATSRQHDLCAVTIGSNGMVMMSSFDIVNYGIDGQSRDGEYRDEQLFQL